MLPLRALGQDQGHQLRPGGSRIALQLPLSSAAAFCQVLALKLY